MLMKQEHENLRAALRRWAFTPLPRVARAASPTRWATCPAEDRDRQIGVPARPSGWGQLSTARPSFHPSPEFANWEVRAGALWCYLIWFFTPPWEKLAGKKPHLFGAGKP